MYACRPSHVLCRLPPLPSPSLERLRPRPPAAATAPAATTTATPTPAATLAPPPAPAAAAVAAALRSSPELLGGLQHGIVTLDEMLSRRPSAKMCVKRASVYAAEQLQPSK